MKAALGFGQRPLQPESGRGAEGDFWGPWRALQPT